MLADPFSLPALPYVRPCSQGTCLAAYADLSSQGLRLGVAAQGTSSQLVYDISSIFVFSGRFLPADASVACDQVPNLPPDTNCGSVQGALTQLAAMNF